MFHTSPQRALSRAEARVTGSLIEASGLSSLPLHRPPARPLFTVLPGISSHINPLLFRRAPNSVLITLEQQQLDG